MNKPGLELVNSLNPIYSFVEQLKQVSCGVWTYTRNLFKGESPQREYI